MRLRGIPFTWQKLLVDAYELSSGRLVVSRRIDGKPQTVHSTGRNPLATIAEGLRQNRSSIGQWLGATALIAVVCGVAQHLRWQLPDPLDTWRIGTTSVACGLIVISSIYSTLRVSNSSNGAWWTRAMIHWTTVMAIALLFPLFLGYQPQELFYRIAAATLLFAAIWLSAILRLLSDEGYRLVWVRKVDQGPALAAEA